MARRHFEAKLLKAISEAGGVLVRKRKHYIWRFPNGGLLVVSGSPSCAHASANAMRNLKKLLATGKAK